MGVCMGKFTKAKHFRLKITSLDVLAQHAKVRAPRLARARSAATPAMPRAGLAAASRGNEDKSRVGHRPPKAGTVATTSEST
jgi:hypothetical protein